MRVILNEALFVISFEHYVINKFIYFITNFFIKSLGDLIIHTSNTVIGFFLAQNEVEVVLSWSCAHDVPTL